MRVLEGNLVAGKIRVGIVCARFNEFIVSKLLSGALDGLRRHGVEEDAIDTAWVPGAFEIPLAASKMASSGRYDAVICLGAVIPVSYTHLDVYKRQGYSRRSPPFPAYSGWRTGKIREAERVLIGSYLVLGSLQKNKKRQGFPSSEA